MSFDLTPENGGNKASDKGTHIGPKADKSKKNPWKGRFDRREIPREKPIAYTVANEPNSDDQDQQKPNS